MPILTKVIIQCDAKDCESTCEANLQWYIQDRYLTLRNIPENWVLQREPGNIKYWCEKHPVRKLK